MFKYPLLFALLLGSGTFALHAQCIQGDCQNGQGTFTYPSGAKYIGHFKNGEISGVGVCYYTDGSKYQGEWLNRFPDGKGTKTYADGTTRTGQWKKGKPVDANGKILEEYIAGKKEERQDDGTNIQVGCLSGNCLSGQGVFAYADGSKYEGSFLDGKFEGEGKFFFANGERYEGRFHQNYPHGQGSLTKPNGDVESGEWKNGEFIGGSLAQRGKVGCIQGDCQQGEGTYIYKEGAAKYVGAFLNGHPHGKGVCTYANGDVYQGEWANGAFGGKGTLVLHDGTTISGYWREGEYVGKDNPDPTAPAEPELPEPANVEPPKVWAVVVGVASYDHMPVLRYTDDDAYRFYAFLKSPEGGALPDEQVQILIDEDATREQVLETMKSVFSKAGNKDLVLFYFSGHGLNGSFLPIDFDGYNNKIAHEEISNIFNSSPAKYKLCVADACHSGSLFAMRSAGEEPVLNQYYKNLSKSVSGTALIMSSKAEETSLESSGLRQGVFSHFLIRGLKGEADKDANKVVSVQELYNYVYEQVRVYTGNRQSPVIKGTFDPMMAISVIR